MLALSTRKSDKGFWNWRVIAVISSVKWGSASLFYHGRYVSQNRVWSSVTSSKYLYPSAVLGSGSEISPDTIYPWGGRSPAFRYGARLISPSAHLAQIIGSMLFVSVASNPRFSGSRAIVRVVFGAKWFRRNLQSCSVSIYDRYIVAMSGKWCR